MDGLNLEGVGVEFHLFRGVVVNDYLQTTNPRIYAGGDVCMDWKFTHAADAAARIIIQNALFYKSKKLSSLIMPWATYTDPEIAHVGMYERDAESKGIAIDTFTRELKEVDRALADGEEEGFVKIHVLKGKDKIVGGTIVARPGGRDDQRDHPGHGRKGRPRRHRQRHPPLPHAGRGHQADRRRLQPHPADAHGQEDIPALAGVEPAVDPNPVIPAKAGITDK